jgi:hypothetical protein
MGPSCCLVNNPFSCGYKSTTCPLDNRCGPHVPKPHREFAYRDFPVLKTFAFEFSDIPMSDIRCAFHFNTLRSSYPRIQTLIPCPYDVGLECCLLHYKKHGEALPTIPLIVTFKHIARETIDETGLCKKSRDDGFDTFGYRFDTFDTFGSQILIS